MGGAVPPLPLYSFLACTGTTLPLYILCFLLFIFSGTGTFAIRRFLFILCDILVSLLVSLLRRGLIVFFPVMLVLSITTEKNCFHSCRHAV